MWRVKQCKCDEIGNVIVVIIPNLYVNIQCWLLFLSLSNMHYRPPRPPTLTIYSPHPTRSLFSKFMRVYVYKKKLKENYAYLFLKSIKKRRFLILFIACAVCVFNI